MQSMRSSLAKPSIKSSTALSEGLPLLFLIMDSAAFLTLESALQAFNAAISSSAAPLAETDEAPNSKANVTAVCLNNLEVFVVKSFG